MQHVASTLSLFLISPFCCCSLSRYKKVPQERYRSVCLWAFLIRQSEVQISGSGPASGSVPKCHGSATQLSWCMRPHPTRIKHRQYKSSSSLLAMCRNYATTHDGSKVTRSEGLWAHNFVTEDQFRAGNSVTPPPPPPSYLKE